MHFFNSVLPRVMGAILIAIGFIAFSPFAFAAPAAPAASVAKTVNQSATLNWTPPTTYTDGSAIASGTAITYNVYEAAQASGTTCGSPSFGKPVVSGLTSPTWATPAYTTEGVWCYVVTSVVASTESAPSNVATVTVGAPVPNPPAALTVQ